MSAPKNGGPAFPRIRNHVDTLGFLHQESDGMTLRQWYAGQALAGFCSTCPTGGIRALSEDPANGRLVATAALALADKLIELDRQS